MLLLVDRNEATTAKPVVKRLKERFKKVIIKKLEAGDVNIPLVDGELLAVERKEAHDFLASIADGRLFDQVERMAQFAKYSAIVITGKMSYTSTGGVKVDGKETNWKASSVRGARRAVQLSGCIVEDCPPEMYPDVLYELYVTCNKPDKRQAIRQRRIVTFPPVDARVETLALFPGIGLKRAESMLQFVKSGLDNSDDPYGRLSDALERITTLAMVDKDLRPEGWGPASIMNVRRLLQLQPNECMTVHMED